VLSRAQKRRNRRANQHERDAEGNFPINTAAQRAAPAFELEARDVTPFVEASNNKYSGNEQKL
jgi:hypothetical protein